MLYSDIPTTSGIYKITCIVTGKFYVGSASNLRKRRHHHFHALQHKIHRNQYLQRAWDKYTETNFVFEVLELVLIPEMLTRREQYWLDTLRPFGDKGFNIDRVANSCLGVKRSPETRAKLRAARLGKPNYFIGGHTPEAIERIRTAQAGRPASAEKRAKNIESHAYQRKTIIVTSPDGTEQIVTGVKQFCREHNLDISSLMRVANGKATHHKGWKARFP